MSVYCKVTVNHTVTVNPKEEEGEFNFSAHQSKDRQGSTESAQTGPKGWSMRGGSGGEGDVFSGVSHLSCCSVRLHFKKCHEKDRQDNQSHEHKTHRMHVSLSGGVCWLCLFAGVINQCWVVRESNMGWREAEQSGPCSVTPPLWRCLRKNCQ